MSDHKRCIGASKLTAVPSGLKWKTLDIARQEFCLDECEIDYVYNDVSGHYVMRHSDRCVRLTEILDEKPPKQVPGGVSKGGDAK